MSQRELTYGKINRDAIHKEREQSQKKGNLGDILKLTQGRNVLRFLPPPKGRDTPFYTAWVHWVPDGQDGKIVMHGCPRKMYKAACISCQKFFELRESPHEHDQKKARNYAPKRQVYAQVVDMTTEERAAKGVQVYAFGGQIYDALLSYLDDPSEPIDFTDPESGYNIIIEREGEKEMTRYQVRPALKPSKIHDQAWLGGIKDLGPSIDIRSPEEALMGMQVLPAPGAAAKALSAGAKTAMDAATEPAAVDEPAWWGDDTKAAK